MERLPAALWPSPALCSQLTAQEVLLTRAMAQAGSHDRCLGKGASSRDKHGVGKTKAIDVNPLCWDKCEFTLISLIWLRMWQPNAYSKTWGSIWKSINNFNIIISVHQDTNVHMNTVCNTLSKHETKIIDFLDMS